MNIVFNMPLKEKCALFFGTGFYGALGIGGKIKIDGQLASTSAFSTEKRIEYNADGDATPDFHNWAGIGYMSSGDFGLTATAGIHFKKVLFSLDYGYGLKNITRGARAVEDKNKNRVFGISIGYRIL